MDQKCYARLSQCNRAIYLSVQHPNLLQKIDYRNPQYNQHYALVRTAVVCKSSVATMFPTDGRPVTTRLNHLDIRRFDDRGDTSCFDQDFLLDSNDASLTVTHLYCQRVYMSTCMALLTRFPNVQFLAVAGCHDEYEEYEMNSFLDSFLQICPNLRGLQ